MVISVPVLFKYLRISIQFQANILVLKNTSGSSKVSKDEDVNYYKFIIVVYLKRNQIVIYYN